MRAKHSYRWAWATLASAGLALALTGPAAGQLNLKQPEELAGLELEQKLDAQVPLDLQFMDEDGFPHRLAERFTGDRPIILTLNYYSCPMLCVLTLNGMVDALKEVELTPGQDYDIVTVSINPSEQSQLTKQKKQNYCEYWGDPLAPAAWHFHTGNQNNINALADSVGYRFRWIPERREYAHPSVLIICTPDGRVSRYLQGVQFDPKTLRLALVEAGQGRIGTVVDDFTLFCYMYDSTKGTYVMTAVGAMKVGGVLTMAALAIWLSVLWGTERRRRTGGKDSGQGPGGNGGISTDFTAEGASGTAPAAGATRA
ncbi:SCO family protein [bacterium]|nr:SCO family protein [bacterium]